MSDQWVSHDTNEGEWVVDMPYDPECTVQQLYFGDMENNTGADLRRADFVARACNLFPELIGLLTQDITGGEHICVCCRRITKDGEDEKHLSRCPVPAVLTKAAES